MLQVTTLILLYTLTAN